MRPARASSIGPLELRRALLLFAIVLGVAAIVTSVSSPPDRDRDDEPRPAKRPVAGGPSASPGARGEGPVAVRFSAKGRPRLAVVGAGRPAVVTVAVEKPGEVHLDGLGLSSTAERLTPARFDVLPNEPGRHRVRFAPAGTREARTIGVLQVDPAL